MINNAVQVFEDYAFDRNACIKFIDVAQFFRYFPAMMG